MKLNGRWFPQIVDRDSGNLYPLYFFVLILSGGGMFRKTILSHFIFSSRFMLFPTFLGNKIFWGGGGCQKKLWC